MKLIKSNKIISYLRMEINCEFDYFNFDGKQFYCCFVTSASIFEDFKVVKSFIGVHLDKKSNKHVEALIFANTRVECLPKNLDKVFRNLKYLEITKCGLKELKEDDFWGLDDLIYLRLDLINYLPLNGVRYQIKVLFRNSSKRNLRAEFLTR